MAADYDDLLQISEAARRLDLSPQRLRTLADEGRIACVRSRLFGRLFDPFEVERFRRSRGPFGRYGLVNAPDAATPPALADGATTDLSHQAASSIAPGDPDCGTARDAG